MRRKQKGLGSAPEKEFTHSVCTPFALCPLSAVLQDTDTMLEVTRPLCL